MDGEQWCTIESDPGVFTELIAEIGVEGVQVEELWSFDKETLEKLKPIYGLIFLFKWRSEEDNRPVETDYNMEDLFFANQVINNACATQAILSILLNCKDIKLGKNLEDFKEFTRYFPPEIKGLTIGNSEKIRTAHNSFARPEPLIADTGAVGGKDDDVFHFISYLPINGKLYELDGLKAGPICLGDCSKADWLELVTPEIQKRIERYSQSEIRFNLMALVRNLATSYSEEIATLNARKDAIATKITNLATQPDSMDVDDLPGNPEELNDLLVQLDDRTEELNQKIAAEEEKFKRWKVENARRKHNYIPFIVNLLKYLAEQDQLMPLIDNVIQ